ncbi:unnamed protein product [Dovyalis caffra]|uniref:Myb/SANT-like domain-containing protein n=1 Tax=Dovyalis caffra TaxID=77055 RepID=A0AAV1SDU4_9ROSI|nr:unnamed protein product [Dovyalis caffra]
MESVGQIILEPRLTNNGCADFASILKIVNRLKTLKDQMGLALIVLIQKSGFSWNDVTKKIDAKPTVWDDLINANDKMRLIRDKQLFNLELLREIYEKDRATDDGAESAKEKVQRWEREQREIRIEDIDEMQINNEIHPENFSSFDNHNSSSTPNNQAQTTSILDVTSFVIERSLFQRN